MINSLFAAEPTNSSDAMLHWSVGLQVGCVLIAGLWSPSSLTAELAFSPAERLGTIFYSAAERKNITLARSGVEPGTGPEVPQVINVNGVVKRQGNNSTAWVNGQPVQEGELLSTSQRVTITVGGIKLDGEPVKVGEKMDVVNQERTDLLAPGALTVRRAK